MFPRWLGKNYVFVGLFPGRFPTRAKRMSRRFILGLAVAMWCLGVGLGVSHMLTFQLTPAPAGGAAERWPEGSHLPAPRSQPTLVVFVHPRCACSRATMAELSRLEAECADRLALQIAFVLPPGTHADWEQTALVRAANAIPGALVSLDADGEEAGRFGARTSGETLLYGADGRLLFHGGITPSRGHEGDNRGRAAIAALVNEGRADCAATAVFGCSLLGHWGGGKGLDTAGK
jgi:hypothetical protein